MSQATAKVNREVQAFLQDLKGKTIDHVFFVACGGSSAIMYPSKYVFDRESKSINLTFTAPTNLFSATLFSLVKSLLLFCARIREIPRKQSKLLRLQGAKAHLRLR